MDQAVSVNADPDMPSDSEGKSCVTLMICFTDQTDHTAVWMAS